MQWEQSPSEVFKTRFYLRKQKSCFFNAENGASILRPSGCNCAPMPPHELEIEICIEMEAREGDQTRGSNIELKIMKLCPYEVLTVTLLKSGEEKRTTCKSFNANQVPTFEIYKEDVSASVSS